MVFQLNLKYLPVKITKPLRVTAREITYNNFEISLVVFMPNITTNHAITYTNNLSANLTRKISWPVSKDNKEFIKPGFVLTEP